MPNGTCRECAAPTPLSKQGKPLMYCSKYCANNPYVIAYRQRTRVRQNEYYDCRCVWCGSDFRGARKVTKFCSDACKGRHYSSTMRTKSMLPPEHPVMLLIAEARRPKPKPPKPDLRTPRECPGCACWFSPVYHSAATQMVTCSRACSKRLARRRRRAREHGARGSWTWSEFMRIAQRFDYCCAYCGERPERLDPDHVVPLSRGGTDTPSNLLPCCLLCNSSKCAMTLSEWAAWRAERNLPRRHTSWAVGDWRYSHLTDALLDISRAA